MRIEAMKTVGEPGGPVWAEIAGLGGVKAFGPGIQISPVTEGLGAPETSPSETFRDRLLAKIEEAAPSEITGGKNVVITVAMDSAPKFGSFG